MLIIKAIYQLPMHICTLCRIGIIAIIINATSPVIVFANNFSQPEIISSPDNSLHSSLNYALNNSTLPLINEVTKLYESRKYNLLWSNGNQYNHHAHALYNAIQNARKLGLNPADYDLDVIKYFLETTIDDSSILGKLDVTFTHAYLKLASDINNKAVSYTLTDEYSLFTNNSFLTNIQANETSNTQNIVETPLLNQDPYSRLLNALEKYRNLSNEFEPIILQKKSLTIGDASSEIIKTRSRLYELGDHKSADLTNDVFDETLALAISDFQYRHGLEADGILGKRTVREINKSIEQRTLQLEVNLDRAKQISELGSNRYILVNVPEYKLHVIENGKAIYQTRVVVGKKKHKTPVLTSEISEFVLNPYWNVPTSITKNEIIPKLQEDPEYLSKNNMKVISKFNNQNIFVDPDIIDWTTMDPEIDSLRIRQDPGKKNALGRVKFVFPNNYRVYLHDTPSRTLFTRNLRAFSHGCVRVENPFELAKVLISNSENWSNEKLDYFAKRKKTKIIRLDKPIPIHITYMTAWADEQGIINFRPDIYKHDSQIANNLYNTAH
ncbi:MAG: L,D-transpeptidase family protein [Gammaproteobacteria bacterium]|nr:MAG: L,D-transpeptidase family protein [Gammaproteobacteria bacterium]